MDSKLAWKAPRLIDINPFGGSRNNPYELPGIGGSRIGWTPSFSFTTIDNPYPSLYPGVQDIDGAYGGVAFGPPGGPTIGGGTVARYSTVAPYS